MMLCLHNQDTKSRESLKSRTKELGRGDQMGLLTQARWVGMGWGTHNDPLSPSPMDFQISSIGRLKQGLSERGASFLPQKMGREMER